MDVLKSLYESVNIYYAVLICSASDIASYIQRLKADGYPAVRWKTNLNYYFHARILAMTKEEALNDFLEWTDVTLILCQDAPIFQDIVKDPNGIAQGKTVMTLT